MTEIIQPQISEVKNLEGIGIDGNAGAGQFIPSYILNIEETQKGNTAQDVVALSGKSATADNSNQQQIGNDFRRTLEKVKDNQGYVLNDKTFAALETGFTAIDEKFNAYLETTRGRGRQVNVLVQDFKQYSLEVFEKYDLAKGTDKILARIDELIKTDAGNGEKTLLKDIQKITADFQSDLKEADFINRELPFAPETKIAEPVIEESIFTGEKILFSQAEKMNAQLTVCQERLYINLEKKEQKIAGHDFDKTIPEQDARVEQVKDYVINERTLNVQVNGGINEAYAYDGQQDIKVTDFIDPDNAEVQKLLQKLKDEKVITEDMTDEQIISALYNYLTNNFNYITDKTGEGWQKADKTIAEGGGDCEDLSILLANLCYAAGVSQSKLQVYVDAGTEKEQGHVVVGFKRIDDTIADLDLTEAVQTKKDINSVYDCKLLDATLFDFSFNEYSIDSYDGSTGKDYGVFEDPTNASSLYTSGIILRFDATEEDQIVRGSMGADAFSGCINQMIAYYQGLISDYNNNYQSALNDFNSKAGEGGGYYDSNGNYITSPPEYDQGYLDSLQSTINQLSGMSSSDIFNQLVALGYLDASGKITEKFTYHVTSLGLNPPCLDQPVINALRRGVYIKLATVEGVYGSPRQMVYTGNNYAMSVFYKIANAMSKAWWLIQCAVFTILNQGITPEQMVDILNSLRQAMMDGRVDWDKGMTVYNALINGANAGILLDALRNPSEFNMYVTGGKKDYGTECTKIGLGNRSDIIGDSGLSSWASGVSYTSWMEYYTETTMVSQYAPQVGSPWFGGVCFKTLNFKAIDDCMHKLEVAIDWGCGLAMIGETLTDIRSSVIQIIFGLEDFKKLEVFKAGRFIEFLSGVLSNVDKVSNDLMERVQAYNNRVLEIKIEAAKALARQMSAGMKKKAAAYEQMLVAEFTVVLLNQMKAVQEKMIAGIKSVIEIHIARLENSKDPFNKKRAEYLRQALEHNYFSSDGGNTGKMNFDKEFALTMQMHMMNLKYTQQGSELTKDAAENVKDIIIKILFGIDTRSDVRSSLLTLLDAMTQIETMWIHRYSSMLDTLRQVNNAIKDAEKAYQDAKRVYDAMVRAANRSSFWGSFLSFVAIAAVFVVFAAPYIATIYVVLASVVSALATLASAYIQMKGQLDVLKAIKEGLSQDFSFKITSLSSQFLKALQDIDMKYDQGQLTGSNSYIQTMANIAKNFRRLIAAMWQFVAMMSGTNLWKDKGGGFKTVDAAKLAEMRVKIMAIQYQMTALIMIGEAIQDAHDIVIQVLYQIKTKGPLMKALQGAMNGIFQIINDAANYQCQQLYAQVQEYNRALQQQLDLARVNQQIASVKAQFGIAVMVCVISIAAAFTAVVSPLLGAALSLAVNVIGQYMQMQVAKDDYKFAEQMYERYKDFSAETAKVLLEYAAKDYEIAHREDESPTQRARINVHNALLHLMEKLYQSINSITFADATINIGNEYMGINPVFLSEISKEMAKILNAMLAVFAAFKAAEEIRAVVLEICMGVQVGSGSYYMMQAIRILSSFAAGSLTTRVEQLNLDIQAYNRMIDAKHQMEDAQKQYELACKYAAINIAISIISFAASVGASATAPGVDQAAGALNKAFQTVVALMKILSTLMNMMQQQEQIDILRAKLAKETTGDLKKYQEMLMSFFDSLFGDTNDPFLQLLKAALKSINIGMVESTAAGQVGFNSGIMTEMQYLIENAFETRKAILEIHSARAEIRDLVRQMTMGIPPSAEQFSISEMALNFWEQAINQMLGYANQTVHDYVDRYNKRVQAEERLAVEIARASVSTMFSMISIAAQMVKIAAIWTNDSNKINQMSGLDMLSKLMDPGGPMSLFYDIMKQLLTYMAVKAAKEKFARDAEARAKAEHPGGQPSVHAHPGLSMKAMTMRLGMVLGDMQMQNAAESILQHRKTELEIMLDKLMDRILKSVTRADYQGMVDFFKSAINSEAVKSITKGEADLKNPKNPNQSGTSGQTENEPVSPPPQAPSPLADATGKTSQSPVINPDGKQAPQASSSPVDATGKTPQSPAINPDSKQPPPTTPPPADTTGKTSQSPAINPDSKQPPVTPSSPTTNPDGKASATARLSLWDILKSLFSKPFTSNDKAWAVEARKYLDKNPNNGSMTVEKCPYLNANQISPEYHKTRLDDFVATYAIAAEIPQTITSSIKSLTGEIDRLTHQLDSAIKQNMPHASHPKLQPPRLSDTMSDVRVGDLGLEDAAERIVKHFESMVERIINDPKLQELIGDMLKPKPTVSLPKGAAEELDKVRQNSTFNKQLNQVMEKMINSNDQQVISQCKSDMLEIAKKTIKGGEYPTLAKMNETEAAQALLATTDISKLPSSEKLQFLFRDGAQQVNDINVLDKAAMSPDAAKKVLDIILKNNNIFNYKEDSTQNISKVFDQVKNINENSKIDQDCVIMYAILGVMKAAGINARLNLTADDTKAHASIVFQDPNDSQLKKLDFNKDGMKLSSISAEEYNNTSTDTIRVIGVSGRVIKENQILNPTNKLIQDALKSSSATLDTDDKTKGFRVDGKTEQKISATAASINVPSILTPSAVPAEKALSPQATAQTGISALTVTDRLDNIETKMTRLMEKLMQQMSSRRDNSTSRIDEDQQQIKQEDMLKDFREKVAATLIASLSQADKIISQNPVAAEHEVSASPDTQIMRQSQDDKLQKAAIEDQVNQISYQLQAVLNQAVKETAMDFNVRPSSSNITQDIKDSLRDMLNIVQKDKQEIEEIEKNKDEQMQQMMPVTASQTVTQATSQVAQKTGVEVPKAAVTGISDEQFKELKVGEVTKQLEVIKGNIENIYSPIIQMNAQQMDQAVKMVLNNYENIAKSGVLVSPELPKLITELKQKETIKLEDIKKLNEALERSVDKSSLGREQKIKLTEGIVDINKSIDGIELTKKGGKVETIIRNKVDTVEEKVEKLLELENPEEVIKYMKANPEIMKANKDLLVNYLKKEKKYKDVSKAAQEITGLIDDIKLTPNEKKQMVINIIDDRQQFKDKKEAVQIIVKDISILAEALSKELIKEDEFKDAVNNQIIVLDRQDRETKREAIEQIVSIRDTREGSARNCYREAIKEISQSSLENDELVKSVSGAIGAAGMVSASGMSPVTATAQKSGTEVPKAAITGISEEQFKELKVGEVTKQLEVIKGNIENIYSPIIQMNAQQMDQAVKMVLNNYENIAKSGVLVSPELPKLITELKQKETIKLEDIKKLNEALERSVDKSSLGREQKIKLTEGIVDINKSIDGIELTKKGGKVETIIRNKVDTVEEKVEKLLELENPEEVIKYMKANPEVTNANKGLVEKYLMKETINKYQGKVVPDILDVLTQLKISNDEKQKILQEIISSKLGGQDRERQQLIATLSLVAEGMGRKILGSEPFIKDLVINIKEKLKLLEDKEKNNLYQEVANLRNNADTKVKTSYNRLINELDIIQPLSASATQQNSQNTIAYSNIKIENIGQAKPVLPTAIQDNDASYSGLKEVIDFYQRNSGLIEDHLPHIKQFLQQVFDNEKNVGFVQLMSRFISEMKISAINKEKIVNELLENTPERIDSQQDFSVALKQALLCDQLQSQKWSQIEPKKLELAKKFSGLVTGLDEENALTIMKQLPGEMQQRVLGNIVKLYEKSQKEGSGKVKGNLYEQLLDYFKNNGLLHSAIGSMQAQSVAPKPAIFDIKGPQTGRGVPGGSITGIEEEDLAGVRAAGLIKKLESIKSDIKSRANTVSKTEQRNVNYKDLIAKYQSLRDSRLIDNEQFAQELDSLLDKETVSKNDISRLNSILMEVCKQDKKIPSAMAQKIFSVLNTTNQYLGKSLNLPEAIVREDYTKEGLSQVKDFYQRNSELADRSSAIIFDYLEKVFQCNDNPEIAAEIAQFMKNLLIIKDKKQQFSGIILSNKAADISTVSESNQSIKQIVYIQHSAQENVIDFAGNFQKLSHGLLKFILTQSLSAAVSTVNQMPAETKKHILLNLCKASFEAGNKMTNSHVKDNRYEKLLNYLEINADKETKMIIKDLRQHPQTYSEPAMQTIHDLTELCVHIRSSVKQDPGQIPAFQSDFLFKIKELSNYYDISLPAAKTNSANLVNSIQMARAVMKQIELRSYSDRTSRMNFEQLFMEMDKIELFYEIIPESRYFIERLVAAAADNRYTLVPSDEIKELIKQYQGYEPIAQAYLEKVLAGTEDKKFQDRLQILRNLLRESAAQHNNAQIVSLSAMLSVPVQELISSVVNQLWNKKQKEDKKNINIIGVIPKVKG
ncbi:MAG: hypothetical protein PHV30_02505 [Candidatus Margulisbacteria bacterium]|nr:hypothetical protein [Candidatus Margulisiibacteriota bacterium]